MRLSARSTLLLPLLVAVSAARAQNEGPVAPQETEADDTTAREPGRDPWIDRVQTGVHDTVWRSAMRIDRMFGSQYDERPYQRASGSIAPALLWDEFNGFKPRLRFNVNLPLPQLNERFDAFIGRVDRDEYVTERAQRSGAFRRQFGPARAEQTLFGISYRDPPRLGHSFDAGAGMRLRFPLDPYVKGGYRYQRGTLERVLFSFRETLFWQESERFGATSRVDLERVFAGPWLVRWSSSGTVSQESAGVRGYSSLMALRGLPGRRAVAVAVGFDGETDAPVPLRDYGVKVAYRQSVARDWLVLEVRSSLNWPKEQLDQPRAASWGVGVGFEMFFGTDEFLARPVTF